MSSKAELGKAIQALRAEIESLEDSDPETREHLAQLANLMEAQLYGTDPAEDLPPNETMLDFIETYEARYPRITAMANDLMTRLAAMGI
jgi:hypothetical protein